MKTSNDTGYIAWFARNSVAANLLMLAILLAGVFSALNLKKEGFPTLPPKTVTVSVVYDSGSAQASEKGITLKIEAALKSLSEIKQITSSSTPSEVIVEVTKKSEADLEKLTREIKSRVDSISTFPFNAEKPVITQEVWQEDAITLSIFGDIDPKTLQALAQRLRQRLLDDTAIPVVDYRGYREPEITIAINETALQAYGLTFSAVADRVRNFSSSTKQGQLANGQGGLVLKADKKSYKLRDFTKIPVMAGSSGSVVHLGDIANVSDGFSETRVLSRFNGKPAISLYVRMRGNADIVDISKRVKEITGLFKLEKQIPVGVTISVWDDKSAYILDRLGLMGNNALLGLILVVSILALFLSLRVAFWVALGLPISFAGALFMMGPSIASMSLNDLTTFGFIIALGIVVDDAVVVGESIYTAKQKWGDGIESTVRGVKMVAIPSIFGVLTTIAALFPITIIRGELAEIFGLFAWVVIFCLIFSIIESKLILPAHLARISSRKNKTRNRISKLGQALQARVSTSLEAFKERIYSPALKIALTYRYAVVAGFVSLTLLTLSLVPMGFIRTVFFPDIATNIITVSYVSEQELGYQRLFSEAKRIETAGLEMNDLFKDRNNGNDVIKNLEILGDSNGSVNIKAELSKPENRRVNAEEIAKKWKERVGSVEGANWLSFTASFESYRDFALELSSSDPNLLDAASQDLAKHLATVRGLSEIKNSLKSLRPNLRIELTGQGLALGFSPRKLAEQLQQSLAGEEVQEFQRGSDGVKVYIRYPINLRNDLTDLKDFKVRTRDGHPYSLSVVADFSIDYASEFIPRVNGKQVATLSGDVDQTVTTGEAISQRLANGYLKELQANYPGLAVEVGGLIEETGVAKNEAIKAFLITQYLPL